MLSADFIPHRRAAFPEGKFQRTTEHVQCLWLGIEGEQGKQKLRSALSTCAHQPVSTSNQLNKMRKLC